MTTTQFTSSLGLDGVNVSFLSKTNKGLPLVISPRFDDSLSFLVRWLESNRSWVETQMLTHGAVLIRDFRIDNAVEFEKAISALQPNLSDSYRGTSPRSVFEGTKYCFSAADVPVNYPIGQHLEMSFLKCPPRQLYFGCLKESNAGGGETSLCDFRRVYADMNPELRQKFEDKGVQYNRTHPLVGEKWTFDVGAMLSWTQMFGTADKEEVEAICREEESPEIQWVGDNKNTFFQQWTDDATQLHPFTKEKVWFNHAQVFHWSTFPAELWYAFTRIGDIRFLLRAIVIAIFTIVKYCLLGYWMALDIRFGDGSPISLSEMNEVRRAVHKNLVFSTWKKGDLMCIDNFSVSHGRQPTYDFGRKILVAWANPQDKTSTRSSPSIEQKSTEQVDVDLLKKCCSALYDDASVPGAVEATPNSTLSSEEAQDLKAFITQQGEQGGAAKFGVMHKRHISCPNPSSLKTIFS